MIKKIPPVLGFAVNTNNLKPGYLFFALKGEKQDGHSFLETAFKKGAKIAVVSKNYQGPSFGLKLIRVKNVLDILQTWAKQTLKTKKAQKTQVIGVTGSVGKTTTKEFISTLLEGKYKVKKTPANQNSQVGLPLSILNMKAKNPEVVVLEMGISQKGEMQTLSEIADVDVGVITNVALVHAENFKNKREIFLEKKEIFSENTKVKIVNFELLKYLQNEKKGIQGFLQKSLKNTNKWLTFSLKNKEADYFLITSNSKNIAKARIEIFEKGKKIAFFEKEELFTETHLLEDFLAAFVVARVLGVEVENIKAQTKKLKNEKMRFEKVLKNQVLFIKDCYNANEKSVIAALENLPKVKGKTIAVLGEMKELGRFSKGCHQRVGKKAFKHADLLICLGKESRFMVDGFQKEQVKKENKSKKIKINEKENQRKLAQTKYSSKIKNSLKILKIKKALEKKAFLFEEQKTLAEFLKSKMQANDLVLVKGSRSLEMEKLFDFLF